MTIFNQEKLIPEDKNSSIKKKERKSVANPLWLSVSEAAKLGGVKTKTIRRAIQSNSIKYKVNGNRYFIDFETLIIYLNSKKKLQNKFLDYGLGQYVDKWK